MIGLFFKVKVLNYFAPQLKVKQHVIHMKEGLMGLLKRMDAKSIDAFVEFAKNNPTLAA